MACDCIGKIDGLLLEHNTRLSLTILLTGVAVPTILTEAVAPKRGFRPVNMLPSFCPFCGTRYAHSRAPAELEGVE